jgi:hypothetical protein
MLVERMDQAHQPPRDFPALLQRPGIKDYVR